MNYSKLKALLLELRLCLSKIESYKENMVTTIEESLESNIDWNCVDVKHRYDDTAFQHYYYEATYENSSNNKQIEISKHFFHGELTSSNVRKLKPISNYNVK